MKRFTLFMILLLALSVAAYDANVTVTEEITEPAHYAEANVTVVEQVFETPVEVNETTDVNTFEENITAFETPVETTIEPIEPIPYGPVQEEQPVEIQPVEQTEPVPYGPVEPVQEELPAEEPVEELPVEPLVIPEITPEEETNITVIEQITPENTTLPELEQLAINLTDEHNIYDANGNKVDATITFEGENVNISFPQGSIEELTLYNLDNTTELPRIDQVPTTLPTPTDGTWAQVYAIDPTNTSFDSGLVKVVAKGRELYKCKDWNFDERNCFGEWALIADDMVPGNTYYLTIDAADPAFGEIIATAAQHIDENGTFVSDIYGSITAADDVWSEAIPEGHFVRVTFEHELENGNVIDFLARDSGSVSYVEVYVANTTTLVGRSGIAGIPEMQYITLSDVPYPSKIFDLKTVKHYHNISAEQCDAENPDCADSNIAENAIAGTLEFDYIHDAQITNIGADGLTAYAETVVNAPRYRLWNNSNTSMGAELTDSVTSGAPAAWIVLKGNHERDETIMGIIDTSTNTSFQIYNGTNWTNFVTVASDQPNTAQRSFDIAVEQVSGDVLFVYENSTVANGNVTYRTWNGTAYSADRLLNDGVISPTNWVNIVERPGSDDIMVLMHHTNLSLTAVLWNGTDFDNSTQKNLSTTFNSITRPVFDFVWEGTSGDGDVVYANSTPTTLYARRQFTYSTKSWGAETRFFTLNGGNTAGMRLCADPNSNYFGLVSQDSTADVNFAIYNGSTASEATPTPPTEQAAAEGNTGAGINTDCAWLQNGTAIFIHVDNVAASEGNFRTCTYNKTAWSSATIIGCGISPEISPDTTAVENNKLFRNPITNEVMAIAENIGEDFSTAKWSVNNWTNVTALETTTNCLNGDTNCGAFAWNEFDPAPNITLVVPSNDTSFTLNQQVNITANISDNTALRAGFVNVTVVFPNGTTQTITMPNISGNLLSALHEGLFNQTASSGRYNFTVSAKDNSSHENIRTATGFFNVVNPPPTVNGSTVVPTTQFIGSVVCLLINVTDTDNISSVIATIDRPVAADELVTLFDTNTCNSIPNDGVFSNIYLIGAEGAHNWTVVNATDTLNGSSTTSVGITFTGDTGQPATTGRIFPSAGALNSGAAINVTLINVSDNVSATQSIAIATDTFMFFNWSASVNGSISDSNVTIEHNYAGITAPTITLQVLNNSIWQTVCSLNVSLTDVTNTCDLDAFVQGNASFLNSLRLRTNVSGAVVTVTQNVDQIFFTANISDATPPVLSFINATKGNISANITWLSDELSNSSVNFGTTLALGTSAINTTLSLAHRVPVSGLTNGTLYYYNVTSCDASGNCVVSGPYNFTTKTSTQLFIQSSGGGIMNAMIEIRELNGSLEANISSNGSAPISPGLKNVRIVPASGPILEFNLTNLSLTGAGINIGYDDTNESNVTVPASSRRAWDQVYAVDPGMNFTSGTITVNASGKRLLKCANWNFTSKSCPSSNWTSAGGLTRGQTYTVSLAPGDPGYGEINATSAEHLDANFTFISDIFPQINASDNVFSETISENHTVRVAFDANLTNGSVVDFIARDNGTVAFVEIYIANTSTLVGTSGIANPTERQFVTLQNMTNSTDLFDLTVRKHMHNLSAEICDGNDTACNTSSVAENNLSALLEFDYIHDGVVQQNGSDGLVAYAETVVNAPRYRLWNNSNGSFGAELTDSNSSGAPAAWIVLKANHMRDETVMGVIDTSTNTSFQIYNGTNWTNFVIVASDQPNTAQRSMDIAIEDVSGDVLFVYENSTVANGNVTYRTWNGTAYSADHLLNDGVISPTNWVKTVARPGSDDIMVLMHHTNLSLTAVLWNGTDFDNTTQSNISTTTSAITRQLFDFVWEGTSGDGDIVFANATPTTLYARRQFTYSTKTWGTGTSFFTLNGGTSAGMRLCADPNSNYFGLVSQDSTADVNFAIYNGSTSSEATPTPPTEQAAAEGNTGAGLNTDCAWLQNGTAIFIHIDNVAASEGNFRTCTYNKTAWSSTTIIGCGISPEISPDTTAIESTKLFRNPVTNEVMAIAQNIGEDLSSAKWSVTNWTNVTTLETTTNCLNGDTECGTFAWNEFDPAPNITILAPANNTNFTLGATVNITANASDNLNVSQVNLTVILPNGTGRQFNISRVQGSVSTGQYEINFTDTTVVGRYNFTVQAKDNSTHNNTGTDIGFFNVAAQNFTNVSVIKLDVPDPVTRGATLRYEIVINNTGNGSMFNVTVVDSYPTNVTFNGSQPSPSIANSTFNLSNLSAGVFILNITVNVSSSTSNGTVLNNSVNITYFNESGYQTSNASALTTVRGFPNISTNKSDSPDPVAKGNVLTYNITVVNIGDDNAFNVTVVDNYPANTTFNGSQPTATGNTTFNLGNFSPGQSFVINITVNVSSSVPNNTVLNNSYNVTFANSSGQTAVVTNSSLTTAVGAPGIITTKADAPDPVVKGTTIRYNITINNTGDDTAFNITVVDNYPVNVTFNGSQPTATGNTTFSVGNLSPGGSFVINITVNVSTGISNGTTLNNSYNVSFASLFAGNFTVTNSTLTTVLGIPGITTTKADAPDPVVKGTTLTYNITITNSGDEIAYNVSVVDNYPVNVTFNGSQPTATGNTTFSIGNLSPSQTFRINITVNVSNSSANNSVLNNTYNVTFANSSGINFTVTNSTLTTVLGSPVIVTIKNDNPDPVVKGTQLNYTILINNTGDDTAFNITIVDTYPTGVTFHNASPTPTIANGTFSIGNLSPNAAFTINITVNVSRTVSNGTTLTNLANATFSNSSGVNSSASDTEATTVLGYPEVRANKTDAPDPAPRGTTLTYNITIVNFGDDNAFNVTVVDNYPANTTFNGSQPTATGNTTFSVGSLSPNQTFVINITVNLSSSIANGTVLNNTFNVTFANSSGTNLTVTNSTLTTVAGAPGLLTTKVDAPDPVNRGSTLTYNITITNSGDDNAFNVTVVDNYPANTTFNGSQPTATGNTTFSVGNLSPSQTFRINITVNVSNSLANGTVLNNTYNVTFANSSSQNFTVTNSTLTTVRGAPNITTSKADTPDPVTSGAVLTYNISISNTGDDDAFNISVVENYPSNVTFNNASPTPSIANGTFNIGNLSPSQNFTINITVNVSLNLSNGTQLNNTYNVTFANFSGQNTTVTANQTTVITGDQTAPVVVILSPAANSSFLINETVNITANVTDSSPIYAVVAHIVLPNGTNNSLDMTLSGGVYSVNFTNLTLRGNYTIRILANDTSGNMNNSETRNFTRRSLNVVDIVNRTGGYMNYSVAVIGNSSGFVNLSVNISGSRIKTINITLHNDTSFFSVLSIDDPTPQNESAYFAEYALDGSNFNFTTAAVVVTASGNSLLFRCKDYNFSGQECNNGNWSEFMNITYGQNYTFTITPNDPGFLETSAAIDVDVAPITATSFVIAFINNASNVSFRVMNTSGSIIVNTTVVDSSADNVSRVSVAMKNATHFVITWVDGPDDDVTYQIFNINGSNASAPTDVDIDVGLNTDVSVTELGSRFVTCYANGQDADADFQAFFNSNGTQAVAETSASINIAPGATLQNLVECAGMNATRWAYFYFDDANNDVSFVIFNEAGTVVTAETDIDAAVGETAQVAATALDTDKFAMVFYDSVDEDITIAVRTSSNTVLLAPTDIDTAAGTISRVAVGAVRQNETTTADLFVPVWYDNVSNDIKAAVYNSTGTQITAPFTVDSQPNSAFQLLEVTSRDPITGNTLCPGRFIVAYSNTTSQGVFKGFFVNGSSWNGSCVEQMNITKTDSPDPVLRGSQLNYTITVNNTGELTAFNVTVVETYPSSVTFNNASPTPTGNTTFSLGNLSAGQTFVINISVNVSSSLGNGSILNNTAALSRFDTNGNNITSNVSELTTVRSERNLTVTKTDTPDPISAGGVLSYTILINNTGNDTAFNITVFEVYPANTTFNGSQPTPSAGNTTFNIGNLTPNASTTINITLNVSTGLVNGTLLNNTVSVNGSNFFSTVQTVNATAQTTVRGAPGLVAAKIDAPDPVVAGSTLTYNITLTNNGDDNAFNVTVIDVYPTGVTFNGSQPTPSIANGTFNIGNLSPSQTFRINITVNVSSSLGNGSVLNNTFNVTFANASGQNVTVTNSTLTTVIGTPVIVTIKNDNPDPVTRGAQLNYTILVNNTGDNTAFNVTVVDTYPTGVTFHNASPAPSIANGTFSIGNLTPNQSVTINITVNVSRTLSNGTTLSNLANATFANLSGQNASATDTETTTVVGFAEISTNKTAIPSPVPNASTLTYIINITNFGDEVAYNVTVTENYPVNSTFNGSTTAPIIGNNTFRLVNLTPNASTTLNITVNISAINGTVLNNSYNVTFANISGANFTVTNSTLTTVLGVPSLLVVKTDTPDPVTRGGILNYTINITNVGDEVAYNITLVDTLPNNVTFNNATQAAISGNTTFSVGNLTPGSSRTVNITVNVSRGTPNGTILSNLANVTFANSSGQNFSSSDTESTTVVGFAEINTNKTDTPDPVSNGSTLRYTINVTNFGDEVAYNVTVVDNYPSIVIFNGSTPAPSSGNNIFALGNLTPNASRTINITVNISASNGTILNNSYNVTFANNSGRNFTVTNSTLTTVVGIAQLLVLKTDAPDPVVRGSVLNYTILINNTGDEVAYNVTLNDTLPQNVTFISASPTPSSGNTTFNLGNLTANSTFTVRIQVNISTFLANGTILNNTANVTFANISGQNASVTDFEETTVIADNGPVVQLQVLANNTNTSNTTIIFLFNATDDISTRLNCTLHINGGNNGTNATTFNTTITNITAGNIQQGVYQWNVTCLDLSLNSNTSANRTFRVDVTPPDFNTVVFTPNDTDGLDPGVRINFTLNVTDNITTVDVAVLHVLLGGSSLVNITMTPNGTDLFNASFTPTLAGNYTFFFTANDTVGNNDTSAPINRTIEFESTWTRTPSSFGAIVFAPGTTGTLGTLIINNTGDFNLTFNLSSTFANTTFNETNFNLTPNQTRFIQVNVTAPSVNGTTPLNITINASPNATPTFNITTATIVVTDDAFLYAYFNTIPTSVTQNDAGVTIEANVTNIGFRNATNVTLFIVLPSDWVLTGGSLSAFFSEIEANATESLAITVSIPSNAITGFRNVTTFADGLNLSGANLTQNNLTQNTTEQVEVIAQVVIGGGGGGGSGSGAGAGAGAAGGGGGGATQGSFQKTYLEKPVLYTSEETLEVVRGDKIGFPLEVTNVYQNAIMNDVTLKVQGYLNKYITWTPEALEGILYGKTQEFFITLEAPAYANKDELSITFEITATLLAPGIEYRNGIPYEKMFEKKVIEYKTVTLLIRGVSRTSVMDEISKVDTLYQNMIIEGYPHAQADALMKQISDALNRDDLEKIPYLTAKLLDLLNREVKAAKAIEQLKQRIAEAKTRAFDVREAEKVLKLAVKAFSREDFSKAEQRALEALDIQFIEEKYVFNFANFMARYWWAVGITAIILAFTAYLAYLEALNLYLRQRLEVLTKTQNIIATNIHALQEATFIAKTISSTEYLNAAREYEARLNKIKSQLSRIQTLRAKLLPAKTALKYTLKEYARAQHTLRNAQQAYFVSGNISHRRYERRAEELKLLIAELDSTILTLKKRLIR